MFEHKYTGLADNDGADFEVEVKFVFLTFNPREETNPEAAIGEGIFEMSTVEVIGWSDDYQPCNAPGCTGMFTCAVDGGYCCTQSGHGYNHSQVIADNNETTLPARKIASGGGSRRRRKTTLAPGTTTSAPGNYTPTDKGYWYSFPKESENHTWWERSIDRRINISCLAEAWREAAGGCSDCGELASQCVGNCIQAALMKGDDHTALKAVWDEVWANTTLCADVPFPDGTLPGSPSTFVV